MKLVQKLKIGGVGLLAMFLVAALSITGNVGNNVGAAENSSETCRS